MRGDVLDTYLYGMDERCITASAQTQIDVVPGT